PVPRRGARRRRRCAGGGPAGITPWLVGERGQRHDGVPQQHRHDGREHPRAHCGPRAGGGKAGSGRMKVAIAGGSGYTGGELLRLLLAHPEVDVAQVTSESRRGDYVHAAHPNLRGRSVLRFSALDDLAPCDVLFLCLPHGEAMRRTGLLDLAPRTIDLSADFRLRDAGCYERWYGTPHAAPDLLGSFVYGLPELHREALRRATHVSG